MQSPGHATPEGTEATVPDPVLARITTSTACCLRVNWAVTVDAAVIETTHPPAPLHEPPQPEKIESLVGLAVSTTCVPWSYVAEQDPGQLIAPMCDVTTPVPVPVCWTVSEWVVSVNVAVAVFAAVTATVHVPAPLHAPLQPVKVEPLVANAVRTTVAP